MGLSKGLSRASHRRARTLLAPVAVPAFRRLWLAQIASEVGDWSARLALSVLVVGRTGSAAMTGLAVAVSLAPWLGPGQLLTSWSEHWPRRRVMIAADLVRALAFGLVALPLPVPALLGLVFVAGLATPPFEAARSALRPEVVPAPLFGPAVALTGITEDLSTALGYLVGGVAVSVLGAPAALLANAGTFLLSAVLLLGLPSRAPARTDGVRGGLRLSARALVGDPLIARAVLLVTATMLAGTALLTLATPLVLRELGSGPTTVGLLVAAAAVVSIIATATLPLTAPPRRLLRYGALLGCLGGGAVFGCFTLVGLAPEGTPALRTALAAAGFAAAGLLLAIIAAANVVVSPRLPGELRAAAFSLLMGLLVGTEAAGAVVAGLAATAVGLVPVCAALGALALTVSGWCLLAPPADDATDGRATEPAGQPADTGTGRGFPAVDRAGQLASQGP